MFTNKTPDGKNNLCGPIVAKRRKGMKISQRELADRLQINGLDIDKNAIQRIECGKRFVTDIELAYLSRILKCPLEELLRPGNAESQAHTPSHHAVPIDKYRR